MKRAWHILLVLPAAGLLYFLWPQPAVPLRGGDPGAAAPVPATGAATGGEAAFPALWPSRPMLALELPSPARFAKEMAATRVLQWLWSEDGAGARAVLDVVRESAASFLQESGLSRDGFDRLVADEELVLQAAMGSCLPEADWRGQLPDSAPWFCIRLLGLPDEQRLRLQDNLQPMILGLQQGMEVRTWSRRRDWGKRIRVFLPEVPIELEFGFAGRAGCLELLVASDLEVFEGSTDHGELAEEWGRSVLSLGIDIHQMLGYVAGSLPLLSRLLALSSGQEMSEEEVDKVHRFRRALLGLSTGIGLDAFGLARSYTYPIGDRWIGKQCFEVGQAEWGDPMDWFSAPPAELSVRLAKQGAEWAMLGMDVGAVLDRVVQVTQATVVAVGEVGLDIEAAFEEQFRVRLGEEVLARLGSPLWLVRPPKADQEGGPDRVWGEMDGVLVGVAARDGPGLARTLDRLLRSRGLHVARKREDYAGQILFSVPLLGLTHVLYVVTEDSLLIGLGRRSRATIQRWLDAVPDRAGDTGSTLMPGHVGSTIHLEGTEQLGFERSAPMRDLSRDLREQIGEIEARGADGSGGFLRFLKELELAIEAIPDPDPSLEARGIGSSYGVYLRSGRKLSCITVW